MAPPGIAFVTVNERAWELSEQCRSPRFYFDWRLARKNAQGGSTPWTPAVSVLFAVQEGLRMMEEQGLEQAYARHRRLAEAPARGLAALGARLRPGARSPRPRRAGGRHGTRRTGWR